MVVAAVGVAAFAPIASRRFALNRALIRCLKETHAAAVPCSVSFPTDDPRGQYQNGLNAFRSGNAPKAIDAFRASLAKAPDDDVTGYYLGLAYRQSGREDEAARVWRSTGASRAFIALGRGNGSIVELQTAIEAGDDDPQTFYELGDLLWTNGRPQEARGVYLAGIAHDAHPGVDAILAHARVAEPAEAIALDAKAVSLAPNDPRGYVQAGEIEHFQLKRDSDALTWFSRCVARTGAPDCYVAAGETSLALGDFASASRFATEARKRAPRSSAPLTLLGHIDRARGRPDEAMASYAEAAHLDPKNFWIPIFRADLELSEGRPNDARPFLDEALRSNPRSQAVHIAFGNYYRQLGQTQAAVAAYERALQIAPGTPEAVQPLSELRSQTK
ncbi:MAG TPA: tetratricopeptide repeat protein [Thermoanaerobaculia bacterium]